MLPDFRVVVELQPGQRHFLLVRDVPACVFWQGFPELTEDRSLRALRAYEQAEHQWRDRLLSRVMIRPRLTAQQVERMGGDSWPPTRAYLEAIGFFPHVVTEAVDAAALLDVCPSDEAAAAQDLDAYRAAVPPEWIRLLLKELSGPMHMSPPALWLMPISEFLFGYHVYLGDPIKARAPLPDLAATRPAWTITAFPPLGRST